MLAPADSAFSAALLGPFRPLSLPALPFLLFFLLECFMLAVVCVLKLRGRPKMPYLAWELLMLPEEPVARIQGRPFRH